MTHPFSYDGLRVVVTGGSSGVGAALLDLLEELDVGFVTVLDRNPPAGPHDEYFAVDLADENAVRATVAAIDGRVDVLFNNAGVADTQPPRTVFAVNYLALRTLSEGLLDRIPEGGAIVNTVSTAGSFWRKDVEQIDELLALGVASWEPSLAWVDTHADKFALGPYNFSKAVVQRYTMQYSRTTMRRGVRTNAACPGPIATPLLADFRATAGDNVIDWNIREMGGRAVEPREVATTLAFLGSPAAGYVNGAHVDIDGGYLAASETGQVDRSGR